jgi:hypothetical protein
MRASVPTARRGSRGDGTRDEGETHGSGTEGLGRLEEALGLLWVSSSGGEGALEALKREADFALSREVH